MLKHFNDLHLFDDRQTVPYRYYAYGLNIGDVIDAKDNLGNCYENFKIVEFSKCWKERPETEEQKQNYKICFIAKPVKNDYRWNEYKEKGISLSPTWIYRIVKRKK